MSSDLDYFYEKDLDKTHIKNFYDSLPTHLMNHFKKCIRTTIDWGNVLQGYRGPHHMCNNGSGDSDSLPASHGIQEVKFWWGARKDVNLQIPVIGTFAFGLCRAVQSVRGELEWSSLYFDSKTGECLSHEKNEAIEKLNEKGCELFAESRYSEAAEYHNNAYRACSKGYRNEQLFQENAKKAETELRAISLNFEGDRLFEEGRYSKAYDKYNEAYSISIVNKQYRMYKANLEKAQAEIDAKNLSSEGDNLLKQGKYSEAQNKYEKAYDKSQVIAKRNIYVANKYKAQFFGAQILLIDTLWNQAWDAENDRPDEAAEIFERILREVRKNLELSPDNSKFKQYEVLVTLKIEGNETFNHGIESQLTGLTLFQEAQELNQQAKYQLANAKFKQAKNYFLIARNKFEEGTKGDQRFASCVEFTQEQIEVVIDSINIIEQRIVTLGLHKLDVNVDNANHSTAPSSETSVIKQQISLIE